MMAKFAVLASVALLVVLVSASDDAAPASLVELGQEDVQVQQYSEQDGYAGIRIPNINKKSLIISSIGVILLGVLCTIGAIRRSRRLQVRLPWSTSFPLPCLPAPQDNPTGECIIVRAEKSTGVPYLAEQQSISVLEVSSFCYYHCYYMHLVECTEQQAHFDAGELCQLLHNVQIWLRLWKLSIHAC